MPPKAQQEASALSLLRPVGLPALPMRHGAVLSTCMQDRNLSALPMSAAPCGALACRVEACLLCPPPCPPPSPAVGCCFSVACLVPATCLPPPPLPHLPPPHTHPLECVAPLRRVAAVITTRLAAVGGSPELTTRATRALSG